jgi:hypothetical protein
LLSLQLEILCDIAAPRFEQYVSQVREPTSP